MDERCGDREREREAGRGEILISLEFESTSSNHYPALRKASSTQSNKYIGRNSPSSIKLDLRPLLGDMLRLRQ